MRAESRGKTSFHYAEAKPSIGEFQLILHKGIMSLITRRNVSCGWRCALIYVTLTWGSDSLWSQGCIRLLHAPHFNQPAELDGWSCILYSLMPLGNIARQR